MSGGAGGVLFLAEEGPLIIADNEPCGNHLGEAKHGWVFRVLLCTELLATVSDFTSLCLSKGSRKRVDRNRRQKEKEVGGVAI